MRTPSDAISSFLSGKEPDDSTFPWLVLCEQAVGEGHESLLESMQENLSPAESAILEITRCRVSGKPPDEAIDIALGICSNSETRDLALEGRARMERGLQRFIAGDVDGAGDDLTWAETRLKSVAKASRNHDLALLNKASFHLSTEAPMMALHTYGEISVNEGHALETLVLSRIGAARILASVGQMREAIRNAGNAMTHADSCGIEELQWQAMTLFLGLSSESDALDGIEEVFDRCIQMRPDVDGPDRPDLRGLLAAASVLNRIPELDWLVEASDSIEDPLLASSFIAAGGDEDIWKQVLTRTIRLD